MDCGDRDVFLDVWVPCPEDAPDVEDATESLPKSGVPAERLLQRRLMSCQGSHSTASVLSSRVAMKVCQNG